MRITVFAMCNCSILIVLSQGLFWDDSSHLAIGLRNPVGPEDWLRRYRISVHPPLPTVELAEEKVVLFEVEGIPTDLRECEFQGWEFLSYIVICNVPGINELDTQHLNNGHDLKLKWRFYISGINSQKHYILVPSKLVHSSPLEPKMISRYDQQVRWLPSGKHGPGSAQ